MDEDDFLDAINDGEDTAAPAEQPKKEAETPPPEAEQQEAPQEPEAKGPARDESGKFKAKEPEAPQPEAPPEPQPAAEAPKQPDPGFIPVAAHIDERFKRQAAEDRAKTAEAELAQFRAQQQQPQQAPDPYENPEEFAAYQDQRVQQAQYQANLFWSERIATIQHGEETVAKAKTWGIERCDADPHFNAKVHSSPDPVGFVVSEWRRDQIASNVDPSEYDGYLAWKAAQGQLQQQQAAPAAPPNPAPAIPPRSLASAPSAGGVSTEVEQTDEEMFAEVIPKG